MPIVKQLLGLAGWLGVTLAAGALGGLASSGAGAFYARLDRPPWAPPAWLFAPVWSGLYLLLGVAAWLVWRERGFAGARPALVLFLVQLIFNALWTWIFFTARSGMLAFAEILILLALIAVTLVAFWRIRAAAGLLLLPYLAWVTFATVLTWSVWRRNPVLLG